MSHTLNSQPCAEFSGFYSGQKLARQHLYFFYPTEITTSQTFLHHLCRQLGSALHSSTSNPFACLYYNIMFLIWRTEPTQAQINQAGHVVRARLRQVLSRTESQDNNSDNPDSSVSDTGSDGGLPSHLSDTSAVRRSSIFSETPGEEIRPDSPPTDWETSSHLSSRRSSVSFTPNADLDWASVQFQLFEELAPRISFEEFLTILEEIGLELVHASLAVMQSVCLRICPETGTLHEFVEDGSDCGRCHVQLCKVSLISFFLTAFCRLERLSWSIYPLFLMSS